MSKSFSADEADLSERVIFPVTDAQSNGIEDARFVEFQDNGRKTFYATYTAYSGRGIRSELLETADFRSFRMTPLRGTATRNKGMGLFPRKIDGRYAMIGRQDNENLHLIYSNDLYTWEGGQPFLQPMYPWEFVQIGNCGSPIELDEGWLLLTHGVGPVRKYTIGAVLLDKDDPTRVLARAREPLVRPEATERAGYVPNVVYTCGAMRHGDRIILPYAISDTFSNFATIKIKSLLEALVDELNIFPRLDRRPLGPSSPLRSIATSAVIFSVIDMVRIWQIVGTWHASTKARALVRNSTRTSTSSCKPTS